jgi:hypothetical protein
MCQIANLQVIDMSENFISLADRFVTKVVDPREGNKWIKKKISNRKKSSE